MSDESPPGVYEAWQVQEYASRGPFWQQLQDAIARAEAAEAKVTQLRDALERVVRHENGMRHAHQRPGIWNDDNSTGIAGMRCSRCADFADARELLDDPAFRLTEKETG